MTKFVMNSEFVISVISRLACLRMYVVLFQVYTYTFTCRVGVVFKEGLLKTLCRQIVMYVDILTTLKSVSQLISAQN